MYPLTRWECCQRPHQLLPLKRLMGRASTVTADAYQTYAQLARSCRFVASYNGGPMMADSRRVRPACVEALWASGVLLWAHRTHAWVRAWVAGSGRLGPR